MWWGRHSACLCRRDARTTKLPDEAATIDLAGVALSIPVRGADRPASVRDLLCDSVANFYLGQDELSWTAVAYALSLRPAATWTNRYGETFSFDDLAAALLKPPAAHPSCGGTHLLFALTVLRRADDQCRILSPKARARVGEALARAVSAARRSQRADGSWPIDWHLGQFEPPGLGVGPPTDPEVDALIATGHLAEYLAYLPASEQAGGDHLRRAAIWLQAPMERLTLEERARWLCPLIHAACALRCLSSVRGEVLARDT